MKRTFLVMLALVLTVGANAQDFKIGHTSFEAIVLSMPEMEGINSELMDYQSKLEAQIKQKEQTIEGLYAELSQLVQTEGPAVQNTQGFLEKKKVFDDLQKSLQEFEQQSQQALGNKQNTLMSPVYLKVQSAVEEVRKELGFNLILNSALLSSGGRVVVAGDEELDITEKVFEKLGVPMPALAAEGDAAQAGANNNGND